MFKIEFDGNAKIIFKAAGDFLLFALAALVMLLIMLGVTYADIVTQGWIPDNSYTEALQESLLVCCVGIFSFIAVKYKAKGLWLVAGFLLTMLIREWDSVFDELFHGAWKYFAVPAALFFIWAAFRGGMAKVFEDLAAFVQKKSFFVLKLGLVIVLLLSRIMGMREVIVLFAGTDFPYEIKNFLEEGTELMGYLTIFAASCRYFWEYRRSCSK